MKSNAFPFFCAILLLGLFALLQTANAASKAECQPLLDQLDAANKQVGEVLKDLDQSKNEIKKLQERKEYALANYKDSRSSGSAISRVERNRLKKAQAAVKQAVRSRSARQENLERAVDTVIEKLDRILARCKP